MNDIALSFEEAFRQAVAHHRAGKLEEAERLYRAVLGAQPRHPDANHNMGALAIQVGRPDLAIPYLKAALDASPATPQYWLSYAEALMAGGKVDEADNLLAEGEKRGVAGPPIQALRERIGSARKDPLTYAIDCVKAGRRQEGEAILSERVRSNPEDGGALAQLGELIRHQRGREAEAAGLLDRATRALPQNFMPWLSYGSVLAKMGRAEEAKSAFLRALEINKECAEAANDLGSLYLREKNYSEACKMFELASRLKPRIAGVQFNFARALVEVGRIADAEIAARHALSLNPKEAEGIRMFLAALGQEPMPAGVSTDFIRNLYAERAREWDEGSDPDKQGYRGHVMVAAAFKELAGDSADILDAGCGTGLVGSLVAGMSRRLDGVDISMEMLTVALERKIYTNLYCCDLVEFFPAHKEEYDTILSAATLIHFGDLRKIFEGAHHSLRIGGGFVFTIFPGPEDKDYSITPDGLGLGGCFVHSPRYLSSLAHETGFVVKKMHDEIHEYYGVQPKTASVVALQRTR